VKRTQPDGVELVNSYPTIDTDPGYEDFLERDVWSAERVFKDISGWDFRVNSNAYRRQWKDLATWMSRNRSAANQIGSGHTSIPVSDDTSFTTNTPSWTELWSKLDSAASPRASDGPIPAVAASSALVLVQPPVQGSATAPDIPEKQASRRPNRSAIAASTNLCVLNAVQHSDWTAADSERHRVAEPEVWAEHVRRNFHAKNVPWLIRLKHAEGEFSVGLAVRNFDDSDDSANHSYSMRWYERKSKKVHSWGKQPGFKFAVAAYEGHKAIPMINNEAFEDFIPIIATLSSTVALSRASTAALREWATLHGSIHSPEPVKKKTGKSKHVVEKSSSEEDEEGGEEEVASDEWSDDSSGDDQKHRKNPRSQ